MCTFKGLYRCILCILKAKQGGKVSSLTTKTTITDIAVSVLNIAYYTS